MSADAETTTGCAKHCEHLSHTLAVMPPIEVWRCCHCGRTREVRREMTGGWYGEDPSKHGPYLPDYRTYFNTGATDA